MGKGNNSNLHKARVEKNDEFYTRLEDIEKELKYYRKHFEDKVVFCNCDDPYESNFFKFFALNFNYFKLKKLIATCYNGSPISGAEIPLWVDDTTGEKKKALKAVMIMNELYDANGDGAIDEDDVKLMLQKPGAVTELKGNGSFDSPECLELLKESDIVCTNPPFSLFRRFIEVMMEYNKKFLIIGNMNAVSYKDIFSYIKNNRLWLGIMRGDMSFTVPDSYEMRETRSWRDESGKNMRSIGNACWFTNLEHSKRNEEIYLVKHYKGNESMYPKYDNYDVINVNKVDDIPDDYEGIMGVPITFLDKYNPNQFEIVSIPGNTLDGMIKNADGKINGIPTYARILIKKK